jgi:hypothetical protein
MRVASAFKFKYGHEKYAKHSLNLSAITSRIFCEISKE